MDSSTADVVQKDKNDSQQRETWTGRFDFFLSTLGYAGEGEKFKLNLI